MNRQTEQQERRAQIDQVRPGEGVELIPVELDSRGIPRRYEVVKVGQPEQPPILFDDAAPIISPLPAAPARSTSHTEGSYQDRARAFGIETLQLSLVVGVLFVIAAWFLSGSTVGLLTLAITYGAGFCATWLVAYLAHVLRSPEGVELYQTKRLWDFLDREQSHRWQRAGIEEPKYRLSNADRLLLGLFLLLVGGVCIGLLLYRAAMEGLL
ncbi:MAG: hypothetical protein KF893_04645 [Caldilineaceae bacterium]|nr:hypothetical protein [Caldilineaceae bacterium]